MSLALVLVACDWNPWGHAYAHHYFFSSRSLAFWSRPFHAPPQHPPPFRPEPAASFWVCPAIISSPFPFRFSLPVSSLLSPGSGGGGISGGALCHSLEDLHQAFHETHVEVLKWGWYLCFNKYGFFCNSWLSIRIRPGLPDRTNCQHSPPRLTLVFNISLITDVNESSLTLISTQKWRRLSCQLGLMTSRNLWRPAANCND